MPRARNRPKPKPAEEAILDTDLEALEAKKDETKPSESGEVKKAVSPAAKQTLSSQLGKGNFFEKGKKK